MASGYTPGLCPLTPDGRPSHLLSRCMASIFMSLLYIAHTPGGGPPVFQQSFIFSLFHFAFNTLFKMRKRWGHTIKLSTSLPLRRGIFFLCLPPPLFFSFVSNGPPRGRTFFFGSQMRKCGTRHLFLDGKTLSILRFGGLGLCVQDEGFVVRVVRF